MQRFANGLISSSWSQLNRLFVSAPTENHPKQCGGPSEKGGGAKAAAAAEEESSRAVQSEIGSGPFQEVEERDSLWCDPWPLYRNYAFPGGLPHAAGMKKFPRLALSLPDGWAAACSASMALRRNQTFPSQIHPATLPCFWLKAQCFTLSLFIKKELMMEGALTILSDWNPYIS